MKPVILIASYQKYFLKAMQNAAKKIDKNAILFSFEISADNELSYEYLYETVLGNPQKNSTIPKLDSLQFDCDLAVSMMDRNEFFKGSLHLTHRVEILGVFLNFWIDFLESKKVNLVFFEEEPHQFLDYILLMASKFLSIKTNFLVRTLPQSGLILSESLENGFNFFGSGIEAKGLNIIKLSEYFKLMTKEYSQVAPLMYFDAPDTLQKLIDNEKFN
ncbi:hypothetical protein N9E28_00895 [Alphaproteobacteria bacterium]|nr:hypothetical protein [Alphaproteobacteria bacterium]